MQRNKTYNSNRGIYTVILEILMFTDFLSKFSCTISLLNHVLFSYMKPKCGFAATATTKAHTHNKIYLTEFLFFLQS